MVGRLGGIDGCWLPKRWYPMICHKLRKLISCLFSFTVYQSKI
jgi:hypothetical protein